MKFRNIFGFRTLQRRIPEAFRGSMLLERRHFREICISRVEESYWLQCFIIQNSFLTMPDTFRVDLSKFGGLFFDKYPQIAIEG